MNELMRRILLLPPQASSFARAVDGLHYAVITASVVGFLAVASAITYFVLLQPPRRAVRKTPHWFEALVISGLLGGFLLFWAVGVRQYLHMVTPPQVALDVHVIAKQWMWTFVHANGASSELELIVPKSMNVRLTLISRDVIHSFYVPAFRIKQDVLPGRATTLWFRAEQTGSFDILCAEYCGLSHSLMRGRVRVVEPAAFDRWQHRPGNAAPGPRDVAQSSPSQSALTRAGERVAAERGCLRCHTLDGSPHLGPSWGGLYGSTIELDDGTRLRADETYLTRSMMDPAEQVRRGYEPFMPSYQGMLSPTETAELVELIRSLAGPTPRDRQVPAALPTEHPATLPTPAAEPSSQSLTHSEALDD